MEKQRQRTIKKVFIFYPTVNHPSKTEQQRDEKVSIFCHLRSLWRKTFVCVCQMFQKNIFGSKIFTPVQIWTGKQIIFLVILCNSIMCKMYVQSNPVSILQVCHCQKPSAKHGKRTPERLLCLILARNKFFVIRDIIFLLK